MLGATFARTGHLSRGSNLGDQECVAGRWLMRREDCATEWDRWMRRDFFHVQEQRLRSAVMRLDATTNTSTFMPAPGYSRLDRNKISNEKRSWHMQRAGWEHRRRITRAKLRIEIGTLSWCVFARFVAKQCAGSIAIGRLRDSRSFRYYVC